MKRVLSIAASALCTSMNIVQAFPMGCKEDDQCPSGYYCESSLLFCQKCLQCESLRREPPAAAGKITSCITSVTECGPCFNSLISDGRSHQCVPQGSIGRLLLPYEWAIISVALFLALLVFIAAVYILRNFNILKIRASTVHSPAESRLMLEASAPLPPPPYSPSLPSAEMLELRPFIKEVSPTREGGECELACNLTARVFNNPSYMRTLRPLSEDSPAYQEMLPPIQENEHSVVNETSATPLATVSVNGGPGAVIPATMARQDSNNNSDEDTGDRASAPMFTDNSTAIFINVIKDAKTLQQRNESKL